MSRQPSWLDRLVARVLSGQFPVVLVLVGLAIAAFIAASRLRSDLYLQSCAVEIFVGSLFFLALYLFRFDRLTPGVALGLLVVAFVLGFVGWGLSQAGDAPLASSILLELASAALLFFVVDLVFRGMLQAAEKRNAALAKSVQAARQQAIDSAKQAAAEGVYLIFAVIDKARTREEIDDGIARAAWDPKIPEPLWKDQDFPDWSMGGILSWKPREEETAAEAESRRLGEEMRAKASQYPEHPE